MSYQGSSSEEMAGALRGLGSELERIGFLMRKANNPAEIQALQAQASVKIRATMTDARSWASKDLLKIYNDEYARGASIKLTKPKADSQAGYALRQKALKSVDRMEREAKSFVNDKAQATLASKGGAIAISRADALERQLPGLRGSERAKAAESIKLLRKQADEAKKLVKEVGDKPSVGYNRRGRSGNIYSRQPWDHYIDTSLQSTHTRTENVGFLRGVRKARSGAQLICRDGDACGWTSHDDTERANGKVVSADEALRHPLSHPNCVRYFEETDKQGVKEAMAAKRARDKQIAAAVAKAVQEQKAKSKAKQAIATATTVAKVGASIYNSQALRIIAGKLYDNAEDLPPALQPLVAKWAKFSTKEDLAIGRLGSNISKETAEDQVRQRVFAEADLSLQSRAIERAGDDALVNLTPHARQILGLPESATFGSAKEALSDYTDYVRHSQTKISAWYDEVRDALIRSEAGDVMRNGEDVSAMRWNLVGPMKPTGPIDAVTKTVGVLKKIIEEDPHRITKAAVGDLAQSMDPLSFARANIGKFRFMVGTHDAERRRLAETLYEQLSQSHRYSASDIKWAKDVLGKTVEGSQLISKDDIIKVLVPRVTFNPHGGLFSATVGLDHGQLLPIFRLYPPGTIGEIFSLDTRLRGGAISRILAEIRQGNVESATANLGWSRQQFSGLGKAAQATQRQAAVDQIANFLSTLQDETVTNLNIWRNGPIVGNVRVFGGTVDSFGLKLRPDQEWFRANLRLFRFEQKVIGYNADGSAIFSDSTGSVVTDISVLPGKLASMSVNMRDKTIRDLTLGVYKWTGNMMETARTLKMSYGDVQSTIKAVAHSMTERLIALGESVSDAAARVEATLKRFTRDELGKIQSLDDLMRWARNVYFEPENIPLQDKLYSQAANKAAYSFEGFDKSVMDDLNRYYTALGEEFPHLKQPILEMLPSEKMGNALAQYRYDTGRIEIHDIIDTKFGWRTLESLAKRARKVGETNPNAAGRLATIWHETGHHLVNQMDPATYRHVWERITALDSMPLKGLAQNHNFEGEARYLRLLTARSRTGVNRVVSEWMSTNARHKEISPIKEFLQSQFGNYASTAPEEMLAEVVSEIFTSPHPSPLAQEIYAIIKDALR